jgi:hypothetical protein
MNFTSVPCFSVPRTFYSYICYVVIVEVCQDIKLKKQ